MPPQFVHRMNRDGTQDSICTGCFMTAAIAEEEDGLPEMKGFIVAGSVGKLLARPPQ
jgi:hypothetical protein